MVLLQVQYYMIRTVPGYSEVRIAKERSGDRNVLNKREIEREIKSLEGEEREEHCNYGLGDGAPDEDLKLQVSGKN